MASSSGSGGRSPKDLKNMIQSNQGNELEFPDEMRANLEKLRALSKDDLSENAMLRSRIEQQAELICILKQRADEALKRSIRVEKENEDMKKTREEAIVALHTEARKYSVLGMRFTVLNSNHEEMITIKDGYKSENEKLRKKNNKLQSENEILFANTVKKREEEIRDLREELHILHAKCSLAVQRQREAEDKMTTLKEASKGDVAQLEEKLAALEEQTAANEKKSVEEVVSLKKELQLEREKIDKVQRDRDEFAQLALVRGRAFKEKQQENTQTLARLDEAEKTLREMEDKFTSELETMSSSAQVRRLKIQCDEVEKRNHDLMTEYEAYKRHMGTLLAREKTLNDKLRVLIG